MNVKKELSGGSVILVIFCVVLSFFFGRWTYDEAESMYVHTYGKDIKVTVTDTKPQKDYDVVSFVYEGKTQKVEIGANFSRTKVGDIVHVRKCENIERFEHRSRLLGCIFGLIFCAVALLFCSVPILLFIFLCLTVLLVTCLHYSPFRYSRLTKRLKHNTEIQYDIVIVDNIKYELMSGSSCMVVGYCGALKDVVIPKEIKSRYKVIGLGVDCFKDCKSLTSIHIPDSVTNIGKGAFGDCRSLNSIDLPASITALSDFCFYLCTSLKNISLPRSVTELGEYCFSGCTSLRVINLPASITVIGKSCFYRCTSLRVINLPASITAIGESCFDRCTSLRGINLPASITAIGESCFDRCTSLRDINLPDSVTALGDYCFQGCTSLRDINLPDSVTALGKSCFEGCDSLTNIKLPEKLFHVNLGKCPYVAKHERLVELNTFAVKSILDSFKEETGYLYLLDDIGEKYCKISLFCREFGLRNIRKEFVCEIAELPNKVEDLKGAFNSLLNDHDHTD